ncbi:hypothetical protein VARIO8X_70042 [Burkholderiales bacterium 8X]|nr:hypothetical protein VARIO8X_70042 [Burkholderiales bacterium 8X]
MSVSIGLQAALMDFMRKSLQRTAMGEAGQYSDVSSWFCDSHTPCAAYRAMLVQSGRPRPQQRFDDLGGPVDGFKHTECAT